VTEDGLSELTLGEVLAAAAEDLPNVATTTEPERALTTWTAGGVVFAGLDASGADFRLDPMVVAAALRTPGTRPSTRGADWVRFAPDVLDDGAVDRVEAWFLSAHRRAARPAR
jgi:hypothetical protein